MDKISIYNYNLSDSDKYGYLCPYNLRIYVQISLV